MQRTEEKGWVTLDWAEEIETLREKIKDITEYYNPNNPMTIEMILWNINDLVQKVNREWQGELVHSSVQATNQLDKSFKQAVIATLEAATEGAKNDQEGNE